MKTKSSWVLFSLFVFLAGCTSLQAGGELQHGRQALLEGKNEAALGYFTAPLKRIPMMSMERGAPPSKVFGVMSADPNILPADFPKPGKPWKGPFPPIEKKILRDSI